MIKITFIKLKDTLKPSFRLSLVSFILHSDQSGYRFHISTVGEMPVYKLCDIDIINRVNLLLFILIFGLKNGLLLIQWNYLWKSNWDNWRHTCTKQIPKDIVCFTVNICPGYGNRLILVLINRIQNLKQLVFISHASHSHYTVYHMEFALLFKSLQSRC